MIVKPEMIEKKMYQKPEENASSLRKDLKKAFKEWLSSSTSHGLPNVVRTNNNLIKIMWITFFIISSAICGYFLATSILEYLKREVVSRMYVVYELPTPFPAVTICNNYPFLTNQSKEFVNEILGKYNLTNIGKENYFGSKKVDLILTNYILSLNGFNPNLTDEFRKTLSYLKEDMLLYCVYNTNPCDPAYFDYYYDLMYGNCFRFNAGRNSTGHNIKILESTRSGKINGLQMEIFLGPYLEWEYGFLNIERSIHVLIDNQSIYPSPFDGFPVSPGKETTIIMKRELVKKLPKPFNDCKKEVTTYQEDDPLLFKQLIKSNKTYRLSDCIHLCLQLTLVNKCDCYDLVTPKIDNSRPCLTLQDVQCGYMEFIKFYSSNVIEKCSKYCPTECDSVDYQFQTFFSDFPTYEYGRFLMNDTRIRSKYPNNQLTFSELKESMVSLNIYYKDFIYKVMDEVEKFSFLDLIANFGGIFLVLKA
jgi:hypothetical protein